MATVEDCKAAYNEVMQPLYNSIEAVLSESDEADTINSLMRIANALEATMKTTLNADSKLSKLLSQLSAEDKKAYLAWEEETQGKEMTALNEKVDRWCKDYL